jgi:hypothetical protein
MKDYASPRHPPQARDPQERIDELLAANIRFEKRARDAEDAKAALQVTSNEAIKAAHRAESDISFRGKPVSRGVQDVLTERSKHRGYGFTDEHDDEHLRSELTTAAVAYALDAVEKHGGPAKWAAAFNRAIEPWPIMFARTPRTNLVYAAALLIAEIDRQDRAAIKRVTP